MVIAMIKVKLEGVVIRAIQQIVWAVPKLYGSDQTIWIATWALPLDCSNDYVFQLELDR
jgi:hypothetical protein